MRTSSIAAKTPMMAHAVGVPKKTGAPDSCASVVEEAVFREELTSAESDPPSAVCDVPDQNGGRRAHRDEERGDDRLP